MTLDSTAYELLNELIERHQVGSFGWRAGQLKECAAGSKSLRNSANRPIVIPLHVARTSVSFVVSHVFFRLAIHTGATRNTSSAERHR